MSEEGEKGEKRGNEQGLSRRCKVYERGNTVLSINALRV